MCVGKGAPRGNIVRGGPVWDAVMDPRWPPGKDQPAYSAPAKIGI